MSTIQFKNEHIELAYGTKSEGNLYDHMKHLEISSITMLDPHGREIAFPICEILREIRETRKDERKMIPTQGLVVKYAPNITCAWGMMTSDCPCLTVIDAQNNVAGMLHLGWWQIYTNIIKKFFIKWHGQFPLNKGELKIFVGPSICGNCFTLHGPKGWLRIVLFSLSPWKKHLHQKSLKWSLDLRAILKDQLAAEGISPEQIQFFPDCTFENSYLSSHRREGKHKTSSNYIIVKMF
ncbi:hypothetical protein A3A03_01705 [Candidatus Nomurabacteria bacterium RIFCSPLOWO2_01_FULL_40_18]|uniref:Laccase domain-containing protein n=1 Tax=Candidatus Nomurabacteria bacterium RIFCSPLOWO2_01_FULL_40_18 TaxID=1801773 RepID=A0A1F6XI14_9BACT|nr:MAG: hypothetical protein A3A03_01705 [Candidatus Nomurabacteria bacterium RIFCSPLOWO2_01_FULL_40_18]